jgi:hypothetical protein
MAGDWIKMRGNLWDDPRVGRLCDLTESTEGPVIGALYWLWAAADQHTEDGFMPGLTLRQIDRKTGLAGFAAALCQIGWLVDGPDGVVIVKFEEHNGASAKRRCSEAQRKANGRKESAPDPQDVRNMSACDADKPRTESGRDAELEKRREEIERNTSVPIGTGAFDAKPVKVTDPVEIIFGYGVPMLASAGTPEKQARSFLGKLRKDHGDEAVISKLRDCIKAKPLQPLEWLAAALPPTGARASPPGGLSAAGAATLQATQSLEAKLFR